MTTTTEHTMLTTPITEEKIVSLIRGGYKPRIKRAKGFEYIYLRRGRKEKEISLGRYTEELWTFLQKTKPRREEELQTQLQELQQKVTDLTKGSTGTKTIKTLEKRLKLLEDENARFQPYYEAMKLDIGHGAWKAGTCKYRDANGYCERFYWDQLNKPTYFKNLALPHGNSFPINYRRSGTSKNQKYGPWHIKAQYWVCGSCRVYLSNEEELSTVSTSIETLKENLATLKTTVDRVPSSTPYDNYKCSNCRSIHLVAVKIQCTKCKHESWWGYHPINI